MIVSFGVEAFACPASFRGIVAKCVEGPPFLRSQSYPNIMRNIMLPLLHIRLRSIKKDLLSFIRTADPTKVRVGERQRTEGEPKLLDTTVGRVVPLLPVAPARASSELEASVDKLFDEGGSGGQTKQGDSASGGHGVGILPKLREDYKTSTVPSVAGKSRSAASREPRSCKLRIERLDIITSSRRCLLEYSKCYMKWACKRIRNLKEKRKWFKSIALKAKKEFSDDETWTSESDDEEYAMAVRNFKKFFRRKGRFVRQLREEKKSFRQRDDKKGKSDKKCFRCDDSNHLIGDCPKPPRNKDQKAFVRGCWSDSENEVEDKIQR
ncbi:zf-CCHC domain-containing protein [Tanacetum coccineum]|uniref:Zf-CCHC domain-containing protein n=1 Tax=Tanacetum coccineum TaxID=301880 RepID=A0ABQ5ENK2_9ASTR